MRYCSTVATLIQSLRPRVRVRNTGGRQQPKPQRFGRASTTSAFETGENTLCNKPLARLLWHRRCDFHSTGMRNCVPGNLFENTLQNCRKGTHQIIRNSEFFDSKSAIPATNDYPRSCSANANSHFARVQACFAHLQADFAEMQLIRDPDCAAALVPEPSRSIQNPSKLFTFKPCLFLLVIASAI
jgi:hypothetical protein